MNKETTAFEHLRSTWEQLGDDDPWWAILSWRGKRGSWDPEEFFATGRAEIAGLVEKLAGMGLCSGAGPVLDFGCGIGRLTLAFAEHFDEVHGVDVASSMIGRACGMNCYRERVSYHLNQRPDLSLFEDSTFRLVHSNLVLQHMPPDCSKPYIREFCRILKPGGMAAFQLPSHRALTLRTLTQRALPQTATDLIKRTKNRQDASMDMFGLPQSEVENILANGALQIVNVDAPETPMNGWYNRWYYARKPERE